MTTDQGLRIHPAAISALIRDVSYYGSLDVETGVMLLTRRGDAVVRVVALAGTDGIERRHGLLVFAAQALAPLFNFAEAQDLQVRAQVHSHAGRAFMSPTDRTGNIRLPGFIVGVVPNFAAPPKDPGAWGWWRFEQGDWEPMPAIISKPHVDEAAIVQFDVRGVRDF